jgi:hypothetical protein
MFFGPRLFVSSTTGKQEEEMARVRATTGKESHNTEHDFVETKDADGNLVRLPIPKTIDRRIPVADDAGNIPEFVNISGRTQQFNLGAPQSHDTIIVKMFEVLQGEQWRYMAEPSKLWGTFPPFMERKRGRDGKFDPVYLLTEEQVLEIVAGDPRIDKEPWIKSWEFGPKRLKLFAANAKAQEYDQVGMPVKQEFELREDRPRVSSAIGKRVDDLEKIAKENMDILTGKRVG